MFVLLKFQILCKGKQAARGYLLTSQQTKENGEMLLFSCLYLDLFQLVLDLDHEVLQLPIFRVGQN